MAAVVFYSTMGFFLAIVALGVVLVEELHRTHHLSVCFSEALKAREFCEECVEEFPELRELPFTAVEWQKKVEEVCGSYS